MIERLKAKFVPACENWWKLWSSWLAAAAGVIITALWNDPTVLKDAINMVPEEYRAWLSPIVFAVATGFPILVRLWPQPRLRINEETQQ